jgi:hypothetical protein
MARRATEGNEALCGRADAHVRAGPPGPAKWSGKGRAGGLGRGSGDPPHQMFFN